MWLRVPICRRDGRSCVKHGDARADGHPQAPPLRSSPIQPAKVLVRAVGQEAGAGFGGKLKVEIYPSMQLGGRQPQLFDQAKDGVVDIVGRCRARHRSLSAS